MTTCLCNIVLTAGADRATDPHGWTLTIISVGVVFIALIILYALYSLSGRIFSGELKADAKKAARAGKRLTRAVIPGSSNEESNEIAAAIAMALDMEKGGDTYAAHLRSNSRGRAPVSLRHHPRRRTRHCHHNQKGFRLE